MTLRLADELRSTWSTFWATTFTFDVSTFEDFVLPRLASGPIAATVLADARRLSHEWDRLATDGRSVRANRDYLVRGIDVGGSFHPKTILLAREGRAVLLVGSGNLTLTGFGEGEVFTRFETGTFEGDAALRAWQAWMQEVVDRSDDIELRRRWREIELGVPAARASASRAPFISNAHEPILHALLDWLPQSPIDELHVAAPFWDGDCSAFIRLVSEVAPRRVVLYLHPTVSVNGAKLRSALWAMSDADVTLRAWDRYVHAKLIGIVTGSDGLLLSGSPNLSDAAFTLTVDRPGANSETATIARGSAADIRAFFEPPGIQATAMALEDLDDLHLEPPMESTPLPLRLVSAILQGDGRIAIAIEGTTSDRLRLTDGETRVEVTDGDRSAEPFQLAESHRFVWLIGVDGTVLSNAVPVDLPDRLKAFARQGRDPSTRPQGFDASDMDSPVGWLLAWLHGECVFDVDEAVPGRGSESAEEHEVGTGTEDDFWDRLQQEELRRDPRLAHYARQRSFPSPLDDEVFLFLEMMLHEAPAERLLRLIRGSEENGDATKPAPGAQWSPTARLRVRLYNVLARWIESLGDPRLAWLDPLAPLRNYSALAGALLYCWLHEYLDSDRLARLTRALLAAFAGSDRAGGFVESWEPELADGALTQLDQMTRDVSSVLTFAALRHDRAADPRAVFEWQSSIRSARRRTLLTPSEVAGPIATALTDEQTSTEVIQQTFDWAAFHEDDEHWCERLGRELDLATVRLQARSTLAPGFDVHLELEPGIDLLRDPRIPHLAREALRYRTATGAMVESGSARLAFSIGGKIAFRQDAAAGGSGEVVEEETLDILIELGAGFEDLLTIRRSA